MGGTSTSPVVFLIAVWTSTKVRANELELKDEMGQAMRKTTIHSHNHIPGHHARTEHPDDNGASAGHQLDLATDQLNDYLATLEQRCAAPDCDLNALTGELSDQIHRVEGFCQAVETELVDADAIRQKQAEFRQRTNHYFSKSFLMNRARTWPRGYPGDYEIIDTAYDNRTPSEGIGQLLDRYFLAATLARGIRNRREKMRDMLTEELLHRPNAQVLNLGCGPCREVLELAPIITQTNAHFTNIDFDTDALLFSAQRLTKAGIGDNVSFRQYNALRMVNSRKNIREFGHVDVIYTIGLLDYLSDEVLVRLIKSLYAMLKPGGVFIAVFKDSDQYSTHDYHWLVDWSGFLQRDAQASRKLFNEAEIPNDAITISRTPENVMIFYRLLQTADITPNTALQGPHDRRQEVGKPAAQPRQHTNRPMRPSWHKPEQTR